MATPPLPKRFQPLLQQAQTEAALRYGSQESGLASLLGQLSRQHQNDLAAQQTANMSLLGSLKGADSQLQGFYNDAGLTPQAQAQLVGSPTGARLAGEMASARTANQGSLLGAQASNQYLTSKINSDFGDRLQQVSDQSQAEQKERGLYTSSLLDQLITGDRSARHDANVAAAKSAHDDLQSELQRQTSVGNALIGQGLAPVLGADGSVTVGAPLPGGKADPNAQKKPKRTTGAGTATKDAQLTAGNQFSSAFGNAQSGLKGKPVDANTVTKAVNNLVAGRPAKKGGVVYEQVPDTDSYGNPLKNADGTPKMKQVPKVQPAKNPDGSPNPDAGQRVTGASSPAVAGVPRPIAQAAVEQAVYGYVTTATTRALQKLGYSVNQIPSFTSEGQYRQTHPASPTQQRTKSKSAKSIRDIYG